MIESYLVDTIFRIRQNVDDFGRDVGGPNVREYRARVEQTARSIKGIDGEYKQMTYQIFVNRNADFRVGDRIQFSPTYVTGDEDWSVQHVFRASGFSISHYEIFV